MCNRFGIKVAPRDMADALAAINLPIIKPEAMPNLEPREDIRPTELAPILRTVDGGLELVERRWWLVPWHHKGSVKDFKLMTTNCRAETAATSNTFKGAFAKRRCLVPASHYFEWTGEKGKKTKWRFTVDDSDFFCFAGLWDLAHTPEGPLESFTLLTTGAGEYARLYHDRQPVILRPDSYNAWLANSEPLEALLVKGYSQTLLSSRA